MHCVDNAGFSELHPQHGAGELSRAEPHPRVCFLAEDGTWGEWQLQSKTGENGVWWSGKLQPAYWVYKGAQGILGRWGPWKGSGDIQDLPPPSNEDLD
jgi:hypothetical protein